VGTDLHHNRHLSAFQSQKNLELFGIYIRNDKMLNEELGS